MKMTKEAKLDMNVFLVGFTFLIVALLITGLKAYDCMRIHDSHVVIKVVSK